MWLLASEGKGQADAAAESVENLLEYHLECLHKQDTHTHTHAHCSSHARWLLDLISTVELQLAAVVNQMVLFIRASS